MKNHIKTSIALFLAMVTLNACSGDDSDNDVAFNEENPLAQYLLGVGYDHLAAAYIDDNNSYEMGIKFIPSVTGQINAVVVKVPDEVNNLRVTIWDVLAATAIRTELVNVTSANADITKTIIPVSLEQGREYAITMDSSDYYMWNMENQGASTAYPITSGNIVVTAAIEEDTDGQQIMPLSMVANAYFGNCSFVFQQTE